MEVADFGATPLMKSEAQNAGVHLDGKSGEWEGLLNQNTRQEYSTTHLQFLQRVVYQPQISLTLN